MQNLLMQYIFPFTSNLNIHFVPVYDPKDVNAFFKDNHIVLNFYSEKEHFRPKWSLHKDGISKCPVFSETELYILAHEFGHYLSKKQNYHTDEFYQLSEMYHFEAHFGQVSSKSYKAVIEEEERAWTFAEWVMKSIGVKDLTNFNILKSQSLETYYKTRK